MAQVVATKPVGTPAAGCGCGLVRKSPNGMLSNLERAEDGTFLVEEKDRELVLQIVTVRWRAAGSPARPSFTTH